MTIETDQGQVCLDVVLNCEQLITDRENNIKLSSELENLLNECARICMGTFYAIKNHSVNASRMAVLCIGICEECAEVCGKFEESLFQQCAHACRYCSHHMYEIAIDSLES